MVSTIRRTLLACLQVYKQWGVSTTSFPLSVSEVYSINASKKDTGANSVPDVQNYSSTGFAYYGPSPYAWFAVCKAQQWGNAGNGGGSVDVTFPISFTKTVYQIQLTCNSDSYENPVYAIKDTKSFSYWSKYGGDKLWFALGMQQWGVINAPAFPDDGQPVTFPVKFSKIPSVITAINQAKNSVSSTQLFAASINTYATTSNMILHRYGGLTASDVRVDWFAWSV